MKVDEELRDAILLLKIVAQGEAEIAAGRFVHQDEALARVRNRLKKG
ncbi:MAG TPA: hypothetical protein VOA87_04290 [Thermoanaerobaculia bacterium]|nr:hypothetical protein [Thermoanaerobaculia bacterium]